MPAANSMASHDGVENSGRSCALPSRSFPHGETASPPQSTRNSSVIASSGHPKWCRVAWVIACVTYATVSGNAMPSMPTVRQIRIADSPRLGAASFAGEATAWASVGCVESVKTHEITPRNARRNRLGIADGRRMQTGGP